MQRHLIARAAFPVAVEVQGHKMQWSGLVQGLEQQVPAALSPSPAGLDIIFYFPCLLFSLSAWQQRKLSVKGTFVCCVQGMERLRE